MKHWFPALAVALLVLTGTVTACSGSGSGATVPATKPASSSGPLSAEVPYSLYTHCGISEARIGATFYVADTPLDDGSGNPPAGWGNPYQAGTMRTPSPSVAIFRDDLGHVVHFHARPGAVRFLRVCS